MTAPKIRHLVARAVRPLVAMTAGTTTRSRLRYFLLVNALVLSAVLLLITCGYPDVSVLRLPRGHTNDLRLRFRHRPTCGPGLDLLLLVATAPRHHHERQAVRDTWGALGRSRPPAAWPGVDAVRAKVRVVFMVGRSGAPEVDEAVSHEARTRGDLLVGDYEDSYRNLTLKTLLGLGWACGQCRAEFLVKTDDDGFVNLPLLLSALTGYGERLRYGIVGNLMRLTRPYREGKWAQTSAGYPFALNPPYVSGSGYAMGHPLSCRLFRAARDVRLVPFEDLFVTGLLGWGFLGLQLYYDRGWDHVEYSGERILRQCCRERTKEARVRCVRTAFSRKVTKADDETKREIWRHLHGNFTAGCQQAEIDAR